MNTSILIWYYDIDCEEDSIKKISVLTCINVPVMLTK